MIKHVAAGLFVLIATTGGAQANPGQGDPKIQTLARSLGAELERAWYQDSDSGAWLLADASTNGLAPPKCAELLAELRAAGAPAATTFELAQDARHLKAGRHALPAAKQACDAIDRGGKIKEVERWLISAASSGGKSWENCISTYDAVIKAGIAPTERVPEREIYIAGKPVKWAGTLEALRVQHCDGPLKAAKAKEEQRQAPFKKVLKADKLRLAIGTWVPFTLPGGATTLDPKRLATAAVWFDSVTETRGNESCPGGAARKTLRRYAFDKQHALIKTTQQDYCGTIPARAFK